MRLADDPAVAEIMGDFIDTVRRRGDVPAALERLRHFIHQDDPAGFRVFYELIRDWRTPRHAFDAIDNTYLAHANGHNSGWECFRGGTKTSTLTEGFTLYQIGLFPQKSNLFVQASDKQAEKHANNVAHQIASNPMFQALFPGIVPDEGKGWSAKGYWIKDNRDDYGAWTKKRAKDPTLMGAGYTAKIVVGSHPTGVFVIDDINDEENTDSVRMSEKVNKTMSGTLFPMPMPETYSLFNQTPWTYHDALAYVKATGIYDFIKTPVLEWVEEGTPGAVLWPRFDRWCLLAWPEMFHLDYLEFKYQEVGHIEFARMYLLDLEQAKGQTLKRIWLGRFPHEQIRPDWPQFIGIDYASTSDQDHTRHDASYAVICWGCVSPAGTLIVEDGVFERMSQQDTYQRLFSAVNLLPRLQQIGIEKIGKGEEFTEILRMAPVWLPLMPIPSHTGLARSKGGRYERVLGPAFQRGDIMLSDRNNEFLKAFEDDWISWNGDPKQSRTDLLDGVFLMAKAAEGYVNVPRLQVATDSWVDRHERGREVQHPFAGIRDHRG